MNFYLKVTMTQSTRTASRFYTALLKNWKHGYCYNCSGVKRNISLSAFLFHTTNTQSQTCAHLHKTCRKKTIVPTKRLLDTNHLCSSVRKQFVSTLYSLVKCMDVSEQLEVPKGIKKPSYVASGVVPPLGKRIPIKTKKQIDMMKSSCSLARYILNRAGEAVTVYEGRSVKIQWKQVGVTTDELDQLVHRLTIENNAYPSPLQYKGFPKSVCTSVNNVACHGIPDSRALMDGDIINIDITVYYNGYHGDCSETYLVGKVDERGLMLVDVARQCRDAGIAVCKHGARFCDIGNTISAVAADAGLNVIPQFCGHGIGENFHELPDIYHFEHYDDKVMKQGMIFTVEPIICDGQPEIQILADGWTAVTCDNSRSAQFEHTVLVTANGVEILTK